jgi:hypothetical protein
MKEKFLSNLVFKLICACFLFNIVFSDKSPLFESDYAKNIFKDLGLDTKERMTREDFKNFFLRVITKDRDLESLGGHGQFYVEISRKMSLQVPEEFKINEAANYLETENILLAIEETVREQYGEEYVARIRDEFKKYFGDKSQENSTNEKDSDSNSENLSETNSASSSLKTEDL